MDLNGQVGESTGEVWRALNNGGPQTLAQLEKKLNGSGVVLRFAVGMVGAVFLFTGLAACAVAAVRGRGGVRAPVWFGILRAM
jgi:hypothetical protein